MGIGGSAPPSINAFPDGYGTCHSIERVVGGTFQVARGSQNRYHEVPLPSVVSTFGPIVNPFRDSEQTMALDLIHRFVVPAVALILIAAASSGLRGRTRHSLDNCPCWRTRM